MGFGLKVSSGRAQSGQRGAINQIAYTPPRGTRPETRMKVQVLMPFRGVDYEVEYTKGRLWNALAPSRKQACSGSPKGQAGEPGEPKAMVLHDIACQYCRTEGTRPSRG